MARQIKWRLQFKSFNGTGCLVNIYEEGYTGSSADTTKTGADVPFAIESGVTELTGSENPFFYDEDNGKDLLQRIRYRTGYIQVIEHSYHELEDLAPDSDTSRYVEFYYGSSLNFVGYIQTSEQNTNWADFPRVWKLPVMSPLGLLEGIKFNENQFTAAAIKNINNPLSYLLYVMCQQTGATYDKIHFPNSNSMRLNAYVNWNLFAPRNSDYWEGTLPAGMDNPRYNYKAWSQILDAVCDIYDWVCHDIPGGLLFTKFNHVGAYMSMQTYNGSYGNEGTASFIGSTEYDFYNLFSLASDKGKEMLVQPTKKVIENFNCVQNEEAQLEITCCHYITTRLTTIGDEQKFVYIYDDLSPQMSVIPDTLCFVNSGYAPFLQETWCAQIVSIGDDDGKMVVFKNNTSYWPDTSISTKVFSFFLPYNLPVGKNFSIMADIETAEDASWDMKKPDYLVRFKAAVSYVTDIYGQGESPTVVQVNDGTVQFASSVYKAQIQTGFVRVDIYNDGWELQYAGQWLPVPHNFMMAIKNLRIVSYTSYGAVRFHAAQTNKLIHFTGSDIGRDVEIMNTFRCDTFNDNRLMLPNSAPTIDNSYRYLGIARRQIETTCKMVNNFDLLALYAGKINLNSKKYRLLALSFNPIDDNYDVTIHELKEEEE